MQFLCLIFTNLYYVLVVSVGFIVSIRVASPYRYRTDLCELVQESHNSRTTAYSCVSRSLPNPNEHCTIVLQSRLP